MATVTVAPYIKGRGPTLAVDLERGTMTASDVGVVFRWRPDDWRPSGRLTDRQEAEHLICFAVAYAERPSEFERAASEPEQIHRDWWDRHGDAMSCEVDDYAA